MEPFHLEVTSLNLTQVASDLVVTLRWLFSGLSEVSWWSQSSFSQTAVHITETTVTVSTN